MYHLANKHDGETCVVIGNGPSLSDVRLERLAERYPTFGSNRIYTYPFVPTYYAIADQLMIHACIEDIQKTEFNPVEMFLPRAFDLPFGNPLTYVVKYDFSFDPTHEVVIGGTVTYVLLQLAYWMGFSKVLLVGVDHNYPMADKGKPGSVFLATEAKDPDHFEPKGGGQYFSKGRMFARPELKGTENSYMLAKHAFESNGRKIINCTRNSKLLVYDKEKIEKYY